MTSHARPTPLPKITCRVQWLADGKPCQIRGMSDADTRILCHAAVDTICQKLELPPHRLAVFALDLTSHHIAGFLEAARGITPAGLVLPPGTPQAGIRVLPGSALGDDESASDGAADSPSQGSAHGESSDPHHSGDNGSSHRDG